MKYNIATKSSKPLSDTEIEYYKNDFRKFLNEKDTRVFLINEIEKSIKNEIMKKLFDLYTERIFNKNNMVKDNTEILDKYSSDKDISDESKGHKRCEKNKAKAITGCKHVDKKHYAKV
jgi:hypothetical protein